MIIKYEPMSSHFNNCEALNISILVEYYFVEAVFGEKLFPLTLCIPLQHDVYNSLSSLSMTSHITSPLKTVLRMNA